MAAEKTNQEPADEDYSLLPLVHDIIKWYDYIMHTVYRHYIGSKMQCIWLLKCSIITVYVPLLTVCHGPADVS